MVGTGFGYYFGFGDRDAGRLRGGDAGAFYPGPGVADLFDRYGYGLNSLIGGGFDDPLCTSLPFGERDCFGLSSPLTALV